MSSNMAYSLSQKLRRFLYFDFDIIAPISTSTVILTKFLKAALSPSSGSELSDDEAICEPAAPCQSGGLLHAARFVNRNKSDEVFEANNIAPRTRMSQFALARSQYLEDVEYDTLAEADLCE
ncbi:hypothetical protein V8E54_008401 [Elaphomyces granulatus]